MSLVHCTNTVHRKHWHTSAAFHHGQLSCWPANESGQLPDHISPCPAVYFAHSKSSAGSEGAERWWSTVAIAKAKPRPLLALNDVQPDSGGLQCPCHDLLIPLFWGSPALPALPRLVPLGSLEQRSLLNFPGFSSCLPCRSRGLRANDHYCSHRTVGRTDRRRRGFKWPRRRRAAAMAIMASSHIWSPVVKGGIFRGHRFPKSVCINVE